MLEQQKIPYEYRDYRDKPLSVKELTAVLNKLGVGPREILRTRDRAFVELGLTGEESEHRLVELMSAHPTLVQRPIGVHGEGAVVGRPVERLLELVVRRRN